MSLVAELGREPQVLGFPALAAVTRLLLEILEEMLNLGLI